MRDGKGGEGRWLGCGFGFRVPLIFGIVPGRQRDKALLLTPRTRRVADLTILRPRSFVPILHHTALSKKCTFFSTVHGFWAKDLFITQYYRGLRHPTKDIL